MEPDLSAFLKLGKTDEAAPQAPARIVSLPRPATAPNGQHNGASIADIYLSDMPSAQVSTATSEQVSETNGEGQWNTVFPPAPAARPRRRHALFDMPSLGLIDPLMADDDVHDILINGIQPIYVDVAGQMMDSGLRFETHDEVWKFAEQIMDAIGQRWSPDRPLIDTRLPDGSRVNIIAPPMAVDGVSISIRKFPAKHITLETMVERKQLTPETAEFLTLAVRSRLNIIISGGTSSGKTTLLNALSGAISPEERIVTIEDSAELRLQQPHVVRLESKPANTIDTPETSVTIRDLVKNALRMRPDRIIVGESRGAEAFDVLQAMNTGHDGSMTTLHSNSPRDAVSRLETMVALAMPQLPPRVIRQQIASTIHLMVQMTRTKDGQRRLTHIAEVAGLEGETLMMQDLIVYHEATSNRPAEYRWVGHAPRNQHVTDAARQSGMWRGLR